MSREPLCLDPRTQEDLCRRVSELAASYTPEWRFDQEDPDIGSTIALIYTGQMADNLRRLNQLPEKYQTEFVNLLGISLLPAYPASGVVVAELLGGTVPGVALPRGSKLMADSESGDPLIFETTSDVYLTNAKITDVLALSGLLGRINPIWGGPAPAQLATLTTSEAAELMPAIAPTVVQPFSLFDFEAPGISRNALLLYHQNVLNTEAGIALRLRATSPGGLSLSHTLADSAHYRWSYLGADGLTPFSSVQVQDDVLLLCKESPSQVVQKGGISYYLLCVEAIGPVTDPVTVADLRLASSCDAVTPSFVIHNSEDLDPSHFLPFGETISQFDECYVGDDRIFSQHDATVTLSFRLSCQEKLAALSALQEAENLKVIKRKPRAVVYETATTCVQRVSVEYFNGTGWRKLPCDQSFSTLFDGTHRGAFSIEFQCPADWRPLPVGGYEGRSLRLRVTQADNCYLLPCRHTAPVLDQLTLSYTYTGAWKQPQLLQAVCGTQTEDLTQPLLSGTPFTAFRPLPYPAAALYLGLDRRPEGAPVSLLFDVEENIHFSMTPITFEYTTRTGFKPLKVIDGTHNFSAAGTMLFMPPSDFAPMEVEGISRYWIRLCGGPAAIEGYHAPIRRLLLNAVEIRNHQTLGEESFYIDTATPHMMFPLVAQNILSAEVFVSEIGQHSRQQMDQMLLDQPEDVRITKDFLGDITGFFVRWTEVENFDLSKAGDRHYMLDRMNNVIAFGDGVHVRIPQAQRGVAFTVRCVCCDGSRGNVPAGAVNSFFGNVLYVSTVQNPIATYAGSDLETVESARARGANILSSRGRLISQMDFVRAVQAFSATIEKVKCLAGRDLDGSFDPALITIAAMTRDYRDGAYSFNHIREPLRQRLLAQCDATVTSDCLVLSEPVYVEISVDVWAKVDDTSRAFDIQNLIENSIIDFLDPLKRPGHNGWDIGTLPTEAQLNMLLQSLRFDGHISRMIAVARYVDPSGVHEAGLDNLPHNPFALGISGAHRVYIEFL